MLSWHYDTKAATFMLLCIQSVLLSWTEKVEMEEWQKRPGGIVFVVRFVWLPGSPLLTATVSSALHEPTVKPAFVAECKLGSSILKSNYVRSKSAGCVYRLESELKPNNRMEHHCLTWVKTLSLLLQYVFYVYYRATVNTFYQRLSFSPSGSINHHTPDTSSCSCAGIGL